MTQAPTIIGSWLTLFVSALEDSGINGASFLAEYDIDYPKASAPQSRISITTMAKMWKTAVLRTGDQSFGLKAGSFVTPTTFSALSLALWSSCSTKDLMTCFMRYLHVFTTAAEISLEDQQEELVLTCHLYLGSNDKSPVSNYALDAALSALMTLCRAHSTQSFSATRVELTRAAPANPNDYEAVFGCSVLFEQPKIRIFYNKHEIEAPIPGGNPQMALATEKMVSDVLMELKQGDILNQVRKALFELLPSGQANLEQVAEHTHLSPRTLHRKLEEHNTSFRQQLEIVRHELALQFMQKPNLSLGEIGFLLGFASSSNFSRAFKRWTGQTPNAFRASHLK
jgi:AraC-like DNA-binding protein